MEYTANKNVLLACRTMEKEITWILNHSKCCYDSVRFIRSGMHHVTESLRREIAVELARIRDARRVVLGFGACGNALVGITAGDFELIIPKADDCISIMLGSYKRKQQIQEQGMAYFLTQGWMDSEVNIYKEYLSTVEKYGKEMADIIYEEILGQYRNLAVIDTKIGGYRKILKETEIMSKELHLHLLPVEGDLSYLERLLMGPWDESEFLRINPYDTVTMEMLRVPAAGTGADTLCFSKSV